MPHRTTPALPVWLAALLAAAIGAVVPVQSRINGELGAQLEDPVLAAAVSFGGGLVVVLAIALVLPQVRRGVLRLPGIVPRTGVLVLGLGSIAGQLIGSLALDVLAPVAGSAVSPRTVAGTLLALVAISIASLPRRRSTRP